MKKPETVVEKAAVVETVETVEEAMALCEKEHKKYRKTNIRQTTTIKEKQAYHAEEMKTLYPEVKRAENPHGYYIDLTRKLLELKKALILEAKAQKVEYDIDAKLQKKI